MGLFFGLLAAICFGLADFVVTQATRRVGVLQALFAIQLFGVLIVGGVLALAGQSPPRSLTAWVFIVGISVVNFVGTLLLYRAFAIGTLSLVSPIASGFAVVTAMETWREQGKAPDQLTAYRVRNDRVDMSRPLCPYPQVAVYKGAGDTNLAVNFVCKSQ